MARQRGSRESEAVPEPEILPLMNIIFMLILALITMSAMVPLGLLSSEAQKLSKGGGAAAPEKQDDKKPLNLIVFITEAGFNISVYGAVKMGEADPTDPARKLPLVPNLPSQDGDLNFDFATLQAKLAEFKKLDQTEESMTITADPKVKFEVIVHTMDAARFDTEKKPLFPRVSFAAGIVG